MEELIQHQKNLIEFKYKKDFAKNKKGQEIKTSK